MWVANMTMKDLRRECQSDVFSYTFLVDHLKVYSNVRGKINRLISSGDIIRVKKGLYVFGKDYRNAPISKAILANLIYGPSYVSGLFALSHHGFIPERVETLTSMTMQRNQNFSTPFGEFEYLHLSKTRYACGIEWQKVNDTEHALFATPEKALVDVISREVDLTTKKALTEFLLENLRIESESLEGLSLERLAKISAIYTSPVVRLLLDVVGGMR